MKILLHIYPDDDGVHCGDCQNRYSSGWCHLFKKFIKDKKDSRRLPECLKAEAEAKEKK